MRRWRPIPFVAALCVVAGTVAGPSATASPGASAEGSWSEPVALEPSTDHAFAPALAVGEGGQAIAAWYSGPPRELVFKSARARTAAWTGSTVEVDTGTASGGFGTPVVLSSHGSDSELDVAISRSGVAYAAWPELPGYRWMIAAAPAGGAFSAPRPLALPGSIGVVGIVASRAGPVAVAWVTAGSSANSEVLHYGLLRADGTLAREVTAGPWGGPVEARSVALNSSGEFAALGVTPEDAVAGRATRPPRPVVTICGASGRCSSPRVLKLGRIPAGAGEQDAMTLSDDGTVTVLASYSRPPRRPGPNVQLGLWESVRRPGRPWTAGQALSPTGEFPVAVAAARDGALAVFQAGQGSLDASQLPASGPDFTQPARVDGPRAPYPPVLAANLAGDSALAWYSDGSSGIVNATEASVFAATGEPGLGEAQALAIGGIAANTMQVGIDSAGEAIVIWSDWVEHGEQGVFAAVDRPQPPG